MKKERPTRYLNIREHGFLTHDAKAIHIGANRAAYVDESTLRRAIRIKKINKLMNDRVVVKRKTTVFAL
jgi:hypothetical protein